MKAIGIDLGTTSICGIVIDTENGNILKSKTVASEAFIKTPFEWERIQSVGTVIEKAKGILDSFIDDSIEVIGITGQMHGIVYYNKDGKAVSELYTWQDLRGNLPYKDGTYASFLHSSAGYGNVTDFYNRVNSLVPPDAVGYCTVHDYLAMLLTGRKTPVIHLSDAASFGCFDFLKNTFTYEACKEEITDSFLIVGEYKGIPVSAAIGDNQASVLASLASDDEILINVGTGSQVSVISEKPIFADGIEARPFFDGKYILVGAALCGGRAYSLLKDFYAAVFESAGVEILDVYAVMDNMLKAESASLQVDTRFEGTRTDPSLTGSISGITSSNFSPYALTRGLLDGMTNELYDMYLKMNAKRSFITGSGNGIRRNPHLISRLEEKFGGKLRIPRHLEEAAVGAAMYAITASGKIAYEEVRNLICR